MFTPVSSQAQAFVPAHAAYPHLRNAQHQGRAGVMLYGAHGQPLPPQQQPEATLPPPQGMYQHPYAAPPPPPLDSRGVPPPLVPPMPQDVSHGKRLPLDVTVQALSLPPIVPRTHQVSTQRQTPGRRSSGTGFEYPDPTNLAPVTPSVSTPGYQTHTAPSPYYAQPQHDRRPSPQTIYPYDARHSSSPHTSPYPPMHTPPPISNPPGSSVSSRGGLNVRDMLNPGDQTGRSSTDSDMLNALNRRGLSQ